ncbi:Thiol-disulfide oxidoreductase ResA [Crateriforma conspicua]|nr:Thiol-disulfide oxidoreductase ResA [Crateriforma conspicua]
MLTMRSSILTSALTPWVLVFMASVPLVTAEASEPTTADLPPVLLQMIRDDAVHEDLELTSDQKRSLFSVVKGIDAQWFPQLNLITTGNTKPEPYQETVKDLTAKLQRELKSILNTSQFDRLMQLRRQALGTRMVLLDDVRQGLELTSSQIQRFTDAFAKTESESQRITAKLKKQELEAGEAARQVAKLQQTERETVVGALTDTQRGRLGSLTGPAFDFSRVRRKLPFAPEIQNAGVTWIQGEPVRLADLRGKVVVVHFYAFQCINCIRNLPHYTAWYSDYADDDLVVLGIQRPETSAERDGNKVASAAKREGIRYPILLDLESSNWNAWGNRIWPSVYLIDKDGFLRRSWYGEMNWQGNEGEKDMRSTLEMLLAEDG